MSKYEPLGHYLRRQKADSLTLTFDQIEKIVGFDLPASQDSYAWWSNNPDNNVMTKVWLDAGWRVKHIRLKEREIVFHRDLPAIVVAQESEAVLNLGDLSPVARSVLSVLAKRSGRTMAAEAVIVLNDALK
jgi:hypothetical protein